MVQSVQVLIDFLKVSMKQSDLCQKVPKEIFVGLSKDQNLNIDKPKVILFKTVDTFGT